MNRAAIGLTALLTFALAALNFVLGQSLISPQSVAAERGAGVAWYLVWLMVLVTVGSAVVLGVFLLRATLGSERR